VRDLEAERQRGSLGPVVLQALVIGVRLRAARIADRRRDHHRAPVSSRRSYAMQHVVRDLMLAVRGAVRRPGYRHPAVALRDQPGRVHHIHRDTAGTRTTPTRRHSAAFVWATSFSSNVDDSTYTREDKPDLQLSARETTVSPRFFETMGIRLIAGRDFSDSDTRDDSRSPSPVVASRSLVDWLFPEGGALGSRLTLSVPKGKVVEIVGIVADVRGRAVVADPEPWVYRPAVKPTWGTIQVRSALPSAQVIAAVRKTARAIDPVVAPHDIETFGATVDRALSEQRLFARVSSVFAVIAALVAALGIYSMMAGAGATKGVRHPARPGRNGGRSDGARHALVDADRVHRAGASGTSHGTPEGRRSPYRSYDSRRADADCLMRKRSGSSQNARRILARLSAPL
jgi:hypothetical protein